MTLNHSCEDIAAIMGVKSSRFIDIHHDGLQNLKNQFLVYIKDLRRRKGESQSLVEDSIGSDNNIVRPIVDITDDGFPIVPDINEKMLKKTLADTMRDYLAKHYSEPSSFCFVASSIEMILVGLAGGFKSDVPTPYGNVMKDQSTYIKPQYLPPGFVMKDPHNLAKDDILAFFDHIHCKEVTDGYPKAFRFAIYDYDKKGTRAPVVYPDQLRDDRGSKKKKPTALTLKPHPITRHSNPVTRTPTPECRAPATYPLTPSGTPTTDRPLTVIDQTQMSILITADFPARPPCNGPNDGSPHYKVGAMEMEFLKKHRMTVKASWPLPIDPALMNEGGSGYPNTCQRMQSDAKR